MMAFTEKRMAPVMASATPKPWCPFVIECSDVVDDALAVVMGGAIVGSSPQLHQHLFRGSVGVVAD